MKKLLYFFLIVTGMVTMNACTKSGTDEIIPPVVKPPDPVLPPAPTLSLKADTALYDGSSTIVITSSNGSVVTCSNNNQIVNGSVVLVSLKNDTTLTFVAKNTNQVGSTTTTLSITVKVLSSDVTKLGWNSMSDRKAHV